MPQNEVVVARRHFSRASSSSSSSFKRKWCKLHWEGEEKKEFSSLYFFFLDSCFCYHYFISYVIMAARYFCRIQVLLILVAINFISS